MADINAFKGSEKVLIPPPGRTEGTVNSYNEHKGDVVNSNLIQDIKQHSPGASFGKIPLNAPGGSSVQAKLAVNKPGDRYEQEADHIAGQVVKTKDGAAYGWNNKISGLSDEGFKKNSESAIPVSNKLNDKIGSKRGGGQKLDKATQTLMSGHLGYDFSDVNIHTGGEADGMNRELNAKAFTTGNDIFFSNGSFAPQSGEGKQLLAHELVHTVQQTKGDRQHIQRITPPDVSGEMQGRKFSIRKDLVADDGVTNLPLGTVVTITAWDNSAHSVTATATVGNPPVTVSVKVDKQFLKTIGDTGAGLKQYEMGVSSMQSTISVADKAIDSHKAKEPEYNRFNNQQGYADELLRLEELQNNRYTALNISLIQETMVNRFDSLILHWVSYYNSLLHPAQNLDANIVKSLLYEETKMGTQGEHLEKPPYAWDGSVSFPIKSVYNLGQAIDSWGPQQYLMIKEMAPAIYTSYGLSALETNDVWKTMSNNEYENWNGGRFVQAMMAYDAARTPYGVNLNNSSANNLMFDYSYWIRVSVRWLFEKYLSMNNPSWPSAVQAYNGSGPKAEAYRVRVMGRVPSSRKRAGS